MRHAEAHATPERAPIASRRVEFDFDRIDGPYWYRENVVATAFLGALSAVATSRFEAEGRDRLDALLASAPSSTRMMPHVPRRVV